MEKLLFRKLIADISFRALTITFTIGLIVWIIQAVNYLDFVIDDGHNFKIYFLYNLYNFPKIIHRILPFVFAISIFFELIKYEKNNELLIFWTNGVTKKKFVKNLTSDESKVNWNWNEIILHSAKIKSAFVMKRLEKDYYFKENKKQLEKLTKDITYGTPGQYRKWYTARKGQINVN